jgi:hypothetical protein
VPLEVFPLALLAAILVTFAAGVYLLIHFRALARLLPSRHLVPPQSRGLVIAALIAFNVGWIASVAIWSFTASGEANDAVVSVHGQASS